MRCAGRGTRGMHMTWGCFFSSRRRHTRYWRDWSSDVCSSDLCSSYTQKQHPAGCFYGAASSVFGAFLLKRAITDRSSAYARERQKGLTLTLTKQALRSSTLHLRDFGRCARQGRGAVSFGRVKAVCAPFEEDLRSE